MARVDVEIFGAGIFGLSIAYSCAKRGHKVRVIEKSNIGAGASGGILGALAPHSPHAWNEKKQFQLDSLLMAANWWEEARNVGGVQSGYRRVGRLQPIANQRILEQSRARQTLAQQRWASKAEWQIINAEGSWMPQSETGLAIFDTLTASIRPRKALGCIAAAIRSLGGEIIEGTLKGFGADIVVHATGHEGLEELNHMLGAKVGGGEKGQAALLKFAAPSQTQIFVDSIHVIPHANGTVAVGSTSERYHDGSCATDTNLDNLIERARRFVPAIRDAPILSRWAGLRPRSSTRAPILGPHPCREGQFIANGGFKIGFGIAPLVGESMADLMLSGKSRIPAAFDPFAAVNLAIKTNVGPNVQDHETQLSQLTSD